MRTVLLYFIAHLAGGICVTPSAILAFNGKEGWGWFLFIGLLLSGGVSIKTHNGDIE